MELSRQMSSCMDLVVEPSQLGSLKGLSGTRNTRVILVRPLTVKVKAYVQLRLYCLGFRRPGAKTHCLVIDLILLVLNCRRVVPLYREVDAPRLSESRPAYDNVRLGLLTILALHYKFCHNGGLSLRALSHLRVLSPLLTRRPQAWYWASRDDHYDVTRPLLGG